MLSHSRTETSVAVAAAAPSFAEEWANTLTHGVGLVLSVVGVVALIVLAATQGTPLHILACGVFGGTLVFMYTASTLYHSARNLPLKRLLRMVDHIAIYLLIAGTYTPFLLVSLGGSWGYSLLGIVWGLALAGTILTVFFMGRFQALSTFSYLAMGWLVIAAAKPMLEAVPLGCLLWIGAGGLFYTGGVVFFAWDRLPYNHAIWHLFVLAGSLSHYVAVLLYVLPA